ncbi:MAG: hypothetical protein JW889_07665, partial [Verrucomicrobia bacterium]|nr:hypothetical protein [Verrucomicrobiota bacterium]
MTMGMQDESAQPLPACREYVIQKWMPPMWLVLGIVFLALTVLTLTRGRPSRILVLQPDGTYTEAVVELSIFDRYHGLFYLALGVFWLSYSATYWGYHVILDDVGVRVQSFLIDRHVAWDDVLWSNVWHKKRLVLGRPRRRALAIAADVLRPREGLVDEILSRVRQPRFLRIRRGSFVPVMAVGCIASITALSATILPWMAAAGAGAVAGLVF